MGLHRGGDSMTDDIGLAHGGAEAWPSIPAQTPRPMNSDSNGRRVPSGHGAEVGQNVGPGAPLSSTSSSRPPQFSISAAHPPPIFSGPGSSTTGNVAKQFFICIKARRDTYIATTWSLNRAATFRTRAIGTASSSPRARFVTALTGSSGLVPSLTTARLCDEEGSR